VKPIKLWPSVFLNAIQIWITIFQVYNLHYTLLCVKIDCTKRLGSQNYSYYPLKNVWQTWLPMFLIKADYVDSTFLFFHKPNWLLILILILIFCVWTITWGKCLEGPDVSNFLCTCLHTSKILYIRFYICMKYHSGKETSQPGKNNILV
jgi:hypothetical protein